MTWEPGSHIGPYEIRSLIGAGGMGEVYRAHDPRLQRDVAIKVLPEQAAEDAGRLARFHQEARAIAALSHPNVLTVYDSGHEGKTHFVVTEVLKAKPSAPDSSAARSLFAERSSLELPSRRA
jgi:eukaryotic-like serine/threonine-protein kinase